jgi:hypothetical protein
MDPNPLRTPVAVTLPFEEWLQVRGVAHAGARHLEPAAEAVRDVLDRAFRDALLSQFSSEEIDALHAARGRELG